MLFIVSSLVVAVENYFVVVMAESTASKMITCRYFLYAFGESGQKYKEKTTFRVRLNPADFSSFEAFQKVIRYVSKFLLYGRCPYSRCHKWMFLVGGWMDGVGGLKYLA